MLAGAGRSSWVRRHRGVRDDGRRDGVTRPGGGVRPDRRVGRPRLHRPVGSSRATDRPLLPGEILATGAVTTFPEIAVGSFTTNEITIIFRPGGGEATGTFAWTFVVEGIVIESVGELVGTYDSVSGAMSGTGTGTTSVGGFFTDDGIASWTASIDPAAGTISEVFEGAATFELTFTPFGP